MKYKKSFKELINSCLINEQYVGLGNPNAKILIIGKEAGFDESDKKKKNDSDKNAEYWINNVIDFSKPFDPKEDEIKNKKHTWQKYQKLHDQIYDRVPPKNYRITFVKNIFTTELSNLPNKKTQDAVKKTKFKSELKKRKDIFFKSDFLKEFPIVIITAMDSNYISNTGIGKEREIDNIFNVEFIESKSFSPRNKYYVHHSIDKNNPKLVIHTRQFSNGVSDLLINSIANEIKKFANKNGIDLYPDI